MLLRRKRNDGGENVRRKSHVATILTPRTLTRETETIGTVYDEGTDALSCCRPSRRIAIAPFVESAALAFSQNSHV